MLFLHRQVQWCRAIRDRFCSSLLLARLIGGADCRTRRYKAEMVRIVFRRDDHEVPHEQTIRIALTLKELRVVLHVVDTRENFLEVAHPELLFLEV